MDRILKSKCRYCAEDLILHTYEDRNIIGELGFTTILYCKSCARNVKVLFSRTLDEISTAEKKALECFGVKENEK